MSTLEEFSVRAWIVLGLAITAIGPASYLWQHVAQGVQRPDITQPPPNLTWRTTRRLYANLVLLVGLMLVGAFVFTPAAQKFADSAFFIPTLLGFFGSAALANAVSGWRTGRVEPLVKYAQSYARNEQPRLFWFSLGWNVVLGVGLLVFSVMNLRDEGTGRCDDENTNLEKTLESCDRLLAQEGLGSERRADLLSDRGRVLQRLGRTRDAIAGYSAALELDPDDSYALYNRGTLYQQLGEIGPAITDLSASLALRPDNPDGYEHRAHAYMMSGEVSAAIDDIKRSKKAEEGDVDALVGALSMYIWRNHLPEVGRIIEEGEASSEAQSFLLRGKAMLAMDRDEPDEAIALLTRALEINPSDYAALRQRSDAYWQTGQTDLSREDDDAAVEMELRGRDNPPYVAVEFPE